MLSHLHSFFDPIGFTSPFLLKGKRIYEECTTLYPHLFWDAPLHPTILGKWKYFATQLEGLSKLTITRWCTGMNDASDIELYVFCDASSTAYEAVAYVVCDNNPNTPSLVMAKSHAVRRSAEAWSLPRKELIAVLEGARIAILSNKALRGRAKNATIWTNTTTVLSWTKNDAICPNRYVRWKLDKLESLYHQFEHVEFQHVQTYLNPVDVDS